MGTIWRRASGNVKPHPSSYHLVVGTYHDGDPTATTAAKKGGNDAMSHGGVVGSHYFRMEVIVPRSHLLLRWCRLTVRLLRASTNRRSSKARALLSVSATKLQICTSMLPLVQTDAGPLATTSRVHICIVRTWDPYDVPRQIR